MRLWLGNGHHLMAYCRGRSQWRTRLKTRTRPSPDNPKSFPNGHWVSLDVLVCVHAQLLRCVWLCDPMDYSPPGSSVHGIFQARTLEPVAISDSRGSTQSRGLNSCLLQLLHWQADSLSPCHLGNPTGLEIWVLVASKATKPCEVRCSRQTTVHLSFN